MSFWKSFLAVGTGLSCAMGLMHTPFSTAQQTVIPEQPLGCHLILPPALPVQLITADCAPAPQAKNALSTAPAESGTIPQLYGCSNNYISHNFQHASNNTDHLHHPGRSANSCVIGMLFQCSSRIISRRSHSSHSGGDLLCSTADPADQSGWFRCFANNGNLV